MAADSAKALTPAERLADALRVLDIARDAIKSNDQWHKDYDDHDGYEESELQGHNAAALSIIDSTLAASPDSAPAQEAMTERFGMSFAEARKTILAMDADAARGMAISLLIQLNIAEKYATPPAQEAAATQQPATSAVPVAWLYKAEDGKEVTTTRWLAFGENWTETPLYAAPIAPEPAQPQAAGVEASNFEENVAGLARKHNVLPPGTLARMLGFARELIAQAAPKQAAASPEIDALRETARVAVAAMNDACMSVAAGQKPLTNLGVLQRRWYEADQAIDRLAAAARQAPTGADAKGGA